MPKKERELQPSLTAEERLLRAIFGPKFVQDPQETLKAKDPLERARSKVRFAQTDLNVLEELFACLTIEERIALDLRTGVMSGKAAKGLSYSRIGCEIGVPRNKVKAVIEEATRKVKVNLENTRPTIMEQVKLSTEPGNIPSVV